MFCRLPRSKEGLIRPAQDGPSSDRAIGLWARGGSGFKKLGRQRKCIELATLACSDSTIHDSS